MSDLRADVVVLGSGAAGLAAALSAHDNGASVLLLEKADVIGGTTAMSGGVAWLPANPVAASQGIEDSPGEAIRYLLSLSNGTMDEALVRAFVETVPEVVVWLHEATPMRLQLCTIPDYHPEHPGGKPGSGRSLEPGTFSFEDLGDWRDRIAVGQYSDPETGDVYLLSGETPRGGGSGALDSDEMATRRKRRINGRGRAVVGTLLKACLDRAIPIRTGARATDLIREGATVVGVTTHIDGSAVDISAPSVVIATGGFEWDEGLVQAFLRGPMRHPTTARGNTGDGLRMAMRAGAMLGVMREAWWVPVFAYPDATAPDGMATSLVLRERSLPGAILVNRAGRRFCNEATNYNALAGAFHQIDPVSFRFANLPCWLIFDAAYIEAYGFWQVPPGGTVPDWVATAETLSSLAEKIGVDGAALAETVARWNAQVADGRDTDFRRGDSAYDGWNGDNSRYPDRSATLGPIAKGPFHAVELHSSTLGTKGGPRTDVDGAVIDLDGQTIPGLYAAGNAMAAPTGMAYGGAGGTLGPALVFGYRAGRRAAIDAHGKA